MTRIKKVGVSVLIVGFTLLFFLAPIIPLGTTNADHYPPRQITAIACNGHCPITVVYGSGYGSISYALAGVGEYYYVFEYSVGIPNILTFIW